MFDFIDNQGLRIAVEIFCFLITTIFAFLGGCKYTSKKNKIGDVKDSSNNFFNQQNK